jgi:hypothetical protein
MDAITRGNGHANLPLEEWPTKDLVKALSEEVRELVREELDEARSELRVEREELARIPGELKSRASMRTTALRGELGESASEVKKVAAPIGAGSVLAHAAVIFALLFVTALFDLFLPLWAALGIVTLLAGVCGVLLVRSGGQRAKRIKNDVGGAFRRTKHAFEEDVSWTKSSVRSLGARAKTVVHDLKAKAIPRGSAS